MTIRSEREILDLIGDPAELRDRLRAFADDHRALDAMHPQLLRDHPREWVAVIDGHLVAHSPDLDALLASTDGLGLERGALVVEFLDPDELPLAL